MPGRLSVVLELVESRDNPADRVSDMLQTSTSNVLRDVVSSPQFAARLSGAPLVQAAAPPGAIDMRCRQASQLISEGFDRALSRSERRRLRLHLLTCTACRRFRAHLRLLHRLLPVLLTQLRPKPTRVRLPADARRRIQGALAGTRRKGSPTPEYVGFRCVAG